MLVPCFSMVPNYHLFCAPNLIDLISIGVFFQNTYRFVPSVCICFLTFLKRQTNWTFYFQKLLSTTTSSLQTWKSYRHQWQLMPRKRLGRNKKEVLVRKVVRNQSRMMGSQISKMQSTSTM